MALTLDSSRIRRQDAEARGQERERALRETELRALLDDLIESAAYFPCLEAVQNAAKHAGDGARATVHVELGNDVLTFSIRDEGVRFDVRAASHGQGLTNLRDRLGALGGGAEITSAPGWGTTVFGRIPLP
jgi:signal transduction histidine kinase